jgi:hypothetical protein
VTKRAPLVVVLASLAVCAAAESTAYRRVHIQKPITVEVASKSPEHQGLLEMLLSDSEADTSVTADELESALEGCSWLKVVTDGGEVAVAVRRRNRSESSRSKAKDGKVTISFRYLARAAIAIEGDRDWIEAEVTDSHTYDAGSSRMVPSYSEDKSAFERVGLALGSKVREFVLARIEQLRPNGPDAGFRHKTKYKWLVKGDGLEVTEVFPGSPAERQGLSVGDRIRRIDGEGGTSEMDERVRTWRLEAPGTPVSLEVERDHARRTIEVELVSERARSGHKHDADPEVDPDEPVARHKASSDEGPAAQAPQRPSVDLRPGMRTEEVERRLGSPLRIVNFGPKAVWSYEGFTVVFVDGVLKDVE